jgi:hypothetical protein
MFHLNDVLASNLTLNQHLPDFIKCEEEERDECLQKYWLYLTEFKRIICIHLHLNFALFASSLSKSYSIYFISSNLSAKH